MGAILFTRGANFFAAPLVDSAMRSNELQNAPGRGRLPRTVGRFPTQVMLLAGLLVVALSGAARAGTTTVYSCHTPTLRSVPTTGWLVDQGNGSTNDQCAGGPAGTLQARAGVSPTNQIGWAFAAPPNTTIASFAVDVCGRAGFGGLVGVAVVYAGGSSTTLKSVYGSTLGCVGPSPWCCGGDNTVTSSGPAVSQVLTRAICVACSGTPSIELSGFRADIRDDTLPVVTAIRGSLATSTEQTGDENLVFDAADVGVGVFRAVAEARIDRAGDWRVVATALVEPDGSCSPLRETDNPYEFTAPRPCPLHVDGAQLTLERHVLPICSHDLRVRLEDAAGNSTVLLAPRVLTVGEEPLTTAPASATPDPEPAQTPIPTAPSTASAAPLSSPPAAL